MRLEEQQSVWEEYSPERWEQRAGLQPFTIQEEEGAEGVEAVTQTSLNRGQSVQSVQDGIVGNQRIRLEVPQVQVSIVSFGAATGPSPNTPLTAQRSVGVSQILGIESGRVQLIKPEKKKNRYAEQDDGKFFQEQHRNLAILPTEKLPLQAQQFNPEVKGMGKTWRDCLQFLLNITMDRVNGLQVTRPMQWQMPFATVHEALLIAYWMQALDDGKNQSAALKLLFQNRNTSRLLVQQIGGRWDWTWHLGLPIVHNRLHDFLGQFPIFSEWFGFAGTENFPSTRRHALDSIFRIVLGESRWITRVLTGGRQALITTEEAIAQNLAAESNGFELANRNQYGTYVGRRYTNHFRLTHRLPVDESILRTFVTAPIGTMLNNGLVHVIRKVAQHWETSLSYVGIGYGGNFGHQRMEVLDPIETIRFHLPRVLTTIMSWRGRNLWDGKHIGPLIRRMQKLAPEPSTQSATRIVQELIPFSFKVCGGVPTVAEPFQRWLKAIAKALVAIEEEAQDVYLKILKIELGLRLGMDLLHNHVSFKIPPYETLKHAVLGYITGNPVSGVAPRHILSALNLTTPRDKRTLLELASKGEATSEAAQLLLGRVTTLLQRELRRSVLDSAIRNQSIGEAVKGDLVREDWYWLAYGNRPLAVYTYLGKQRSTGKHLVMHVDSGNDHFISETEMRNGVVAFTYTPIAEAISRAQRMFCLIELEHGRIFSYNAFMEFSHMRSALRQLMVVSQMNCEALDDARLNVLREVQRAGPQTISPEDMVAGTTYYRHIESSNEYIPFECEAQCRKGDSVWAQLSRHRYVKSPPQNILVIGGGPTGLITVVHCVENVLATGGVMKLYEARDAFDKGGSTFERAQVVRLDSRWINMMRYHLGTTFEDVYIPSSGETDAQLGNTLPNQGFVEITIKDLENMLHIEISKLWSKGLIQVYTGSRASYDAETNSVIKFGKHLKVGDFIYRNVDRYGKKSADKHSWKVFDLKYTGTLDYTNLQIGHEYGVFSRKEQAVLPFVLVSINLQTGRYAFKAQLQGIDDVVCSQQNLPSIYPQGTERGAHSYIHTIVLESVEPKRGGIYIQDEITMKDIQDDKFVLDLGRTHVVEAIGKPNKSKVHFDMTTNEPYGVCCIQGLKVSLGMHNFGQTRFGNGLLDDIRSVNDQNTRIIGDFTKMVRNGPIITRMHQLITSNRNWQHHFNMLVTTAGFEGLANRGYVVSHITHACDQLVRAAPSFRRPTLQTRFFETGDNYYLGMEFPREYDAWKNSLADVLVVPLRNADGIDQGKVNKLRGTMASHIDRLWYEACLEIIREGDVYNAGARHRVPSIYLINSYFDQPLGDLPVGENFRLSNNSKEKYEIVMKKSGVVVVRNVEGYISQMTPSTQVKLEGNLTRGPDGNAESKVSIATFPVAHYVNHRTMRLLDPENGYVIAFVGDEQASPHFMRYSGLTGACINAMSMNLFVKKSIDGIPFLDRFRDYTLETTWSNGEVVTRGTGANYGDDGFLRPGFAYYKLIDYLHSKILEARETELPEDQLLSDDWKTKFAAGLVPRGMEMHSGFIRTLRMKLYDCAFDKCIKLINNEHIEPILLDLWNNRNLEDPVSRFWEDARSSGLDGSIVDEFAPNMALMVRVLDNLIDFAGQQFMSNARVSSELANQPRPVDSVYDDFAVEAQNFANSLTQSAAFAAAVQSLNLIGNDMLPRTAAILLSLFNVSLAFSTITGVSRYKIRNEEARVIFWREKFQPVKRAVFAAMQKNAQDDVTQRDLNNNPLILQVSRNVEQFRADLQYYGLKETEEFTAEYAQFQRNCNDPEAVARFKESIALKFAANVYYDNSYVQAALIDIYRTLDDMDYLLTFGQSLRVTDEARPLFDRVSAFEARLKKSLQLGRVRWGFVKNRRFMHWNIVTAIRYFISLFCCASARRQSCLAPIQTETLGIARQLKRVSGIHQGQILRREVRDMDGLYWATRESDIASLIFMTGLSVFFLSIIISIGNIIRWSKLSQGAGLVLLPVAFLGASLAVFHLVRKMGILLRLLSILSRKASTDVQQKSLRTIRNVTFVHTILIFMRLFTAATAMIFQPLAFYNAVHSFFGFENPINPDYAPWVALITFLSAVLATIMFFFVEYLIRYNLPVDLGAVIGRTFQSELYAIYNDVKARKNDIDTMQQQEKENWDYTAREFLHLYRFDTVFAADRFGGILQFIQAGLSDPNNKDGSSVGPTSHSTF